MKTLINGKTPEQIMEETRRINKRKLESPINTNPSNPKLLPADYEQLFHSNDVKHWNIYLIVKRFIEIQGFYTCTYEGKKTVIVA